MKFNKNQTAGVRRAVRVRLEAILEEEEITYKRWQENNKEKLNITRQKMVEREFNKRIQAFKITINSLMPYWERTEDVPTFVIRKKKE